MPPLIDISQSSQHLRIRLLRRTLLSTVSIAFLALSLPLSTSSAQSLEELRTSKTMREFGQKKPASDPYAPGLPRKYQLLKGIDPNSNFATIWMSDEGTMEMLGWVSARLPHFSYSKPFGGRTRESVKAGIRLTRNKNSPVDIVIIIPHPTLAPLVERNILVEYKKYRPPVLKVTSEKSITLPTGKATLYEHTQGACSVFIPISQMGFINIRTEKCTSSELLIEIANGLDIERLNRKLDS